MAETGDAQTKVAGVYSRLEFPEPRQDRPYVFINMVATIDGKTVSGERDEPVTDIGSDTDHATMRQIEGAADAVLIGAGSLRATKGLHYGPRLIRLVATQSGDLPYESAFFTESPDRAFVVVSQSNASNVPPGVKSMIAGDSSIDWNIVLNNLRSELRVSRLLVEGGSELNASLLSLDLVDELFVTVAPLIKLGSTTPTYADGDPLPRNKMKRFSLVSTIVNGDEVFLRYVRHR